MRTVFFDIAFSPALLTTLWRAAAIFDKCSIHHFYTDCKEEKNVVNLKLTRWGGEKRRRMENQDYKGKEDLAEQIRNALKGAFESLEFEQLNHVIGDTVHSALDKIRPTARSLPPKPLKIRVNKRGRAAGILLTVFGSIGAVVFLAWALALLAAMATLQSTIGWWVSGALGLTTGGFLILLIVGVRTNTRIGRLNIYLKELKNHGKPYCELWRLSKSSAKSLKFVQKDIRKMLKLGMFPDARLDDEETCLLLDDYTYKQYREAQDSFRERQQKEEERQSRQSGEPVWEAISRGEEYKRALTSLWETMPNQPISEKILRLRVLLDRLFEALKKHPEQLEDMERLMEYYLPTTVKLVTSYQEFANVEFPGENVKRAKKEIEQTMDAINHGLEKLLDDFYQDTAFDVLSDASVLQSMLAREGLTQDGNIKL